MNRHVSGGVDKALQRSQRTTTPVKQSPVRHGSLSLNISDPGDLVSRDRVQINLVSAMVVSRCWHIDRQ